MPILCRSGFSGGLDDECENLRDGSLVQMPLIVRADVQAWDPNAEVKLTWIVADTQKNIRLTSRQVSVPSSLSGYIGEELRQYCRHNIPAPPVLPLFRIQRFVNLADNIFIGLNPLLQPSRDRVRTKFVWWLVLDSNGRST